jgi:hypothetical protein
MKDILSDDLLQHVELAIRTPSGTWPTEGFMEVPAQQDVREELIRAAEALGIQAHIKGWEASSEGQIIDTRATFIENGLSGEVIIQYGPPDHCVHKGC